MTKSVILGKAKVMSYEDLEDARAKRAEKEAAKGAKGKEDAAGSRKALRHRQRKPPWTTGDAVESARGLRQRQVCQSRRPRRRG